MTSINVPSVAPLNIDSSRTAAASSHGFKYVVRPFHNESDCHPVRVRNKNAKNWTSLMNHWTHLNPISSTMFIHFGRWKLLQGFANFSPFQGSQFLVSKRRIRARPLGDYVRMLQLVDGTVADQCEPWRISWESKLLNLYHLLMFVNVCSSIYVDLC